MKKLLIILASICLALSFQSCDETIASTLEGTWEGNMHIKAAYQGHYYQTVKTTIYFELNPFRFTKGKGYWIDYYSGAPWDYVASHITWRVQDRIITVHFEEENTEIEIHDYNLNNDYFTGYFLDGTNRVTFSLVHTSDLTWSDYFKQGYYSKQSNQAERPVRMIDATH